MTEKQKAINSYMEKLGLTEQEAIELWNDDHSEQDLPEVVKMTEKAKHIKRYEKSATPRKKSTRVRKVDSEKAEILKSLLSQLISEGAEIQKVQTETIVLFTFNGNNYSIKLTKHTEKIFEKMKKDIDNKSKK